MSNMKVACPNCAALYEVELVFVGRKLQCDRCAAKFYLERGQGGVVEPRPSIRCPGCGVEYAVEPGLLGKTACCADCGTQFELAVELAVAQ